tara:strand:+ start:3348 stop:4424 length:1077 start_codon:yes stop_codon:yes gene_type:complete
MKIDKLTLNNYEEVKLLSTKYKLNVLEKDDWENIWKNNPYILNTQKDWINGWVLKNDQNKIVGLIHNIPFIFYYNKKKFLGAICGNWVIDEKYKALSLNIRSKFLNQQNIDLYITNTANEISEKVMEAFKAKKISQYEYGNRLVYILNKKKIIFNYIRRIFKIKNVISDIKNIKKLFFHNNANFKESFDVSNNFSKDFNDLNENLSEKKEFFSSKDYEWLNWKYSRLLNTDKLWVIKKYENKKLVGFLTLIVNYEKNFHLKKSTIVELSFLNNNEKDILEILKKSISISKKLNCDLIDVVGFSKYKKILLKQIGFFNRQTGNFGFLVKNSNSEIENILFRNENDLDMSLTDGDAIFNV